MKTIFDHIEHVRGKPHHIRKQVTFASATVFTALIALVWFAGSLSVGTFAIHDNSFATATGGPEATIGVGTDGNQNLAGAASALTQPASAPAHIEIIDTTPPSAKKQQAEQTVLPF